MLAEAGVELFQEPVEIGTAQDGIPVMGLRFTPKFLAAADDIEKPVESSVIEERAGNTKERKRSKKKRRIEAEESLSN